jgi:hypothetical protein
MKTTVERRGEKQVPPFGRNDKPDFRNDNLDLWNDKMELGDDKADLRNDKPDLCDHKLDLWNDGGGLLDQRSLWGRSCATAGAVVWAGIAVLARAGMVRVGAIELLFLFAPLVIVPLGMELGRVLGGAGRFEELAQRLQPVGAGLAVVAMWLPPGKSAGLAALGWMVVCLLMAGGGAGRMVRSVWRSWEQFRQERTGEAPVATRVGATRALATPSLGTPSLGTRVAEIAGAVARIDLAVGGAWLVASRLGMRPMGIQEPIGLLTAVHFHFAGFATATIAAATLQFAERRGKYRWLKPVVLMVVGLPIVVAAGFVISPIMKMVAAILFSASVAGLAIAVRGCGRRAEEKTARILLQVAAGAVFAGMVVSGAYAVADYMGSDALTIPQMARTHGVLNAVGFCLTGLLGWLVETSSGQ